MNVISSSYGNDSTAMIQWAQHGPNRPGIDEEEAECASLFGCGT